jgi:hypothetical protein
VTREYSIRVMISENSLYSTLGIEGRGVVESVEFVESDIAFLICLDNLFLWVKFFKIGLKLINMLCRRCFIYISECMAKFPNSWRVIKMRHGNRIFNAFCLMPNACKVILSEN